MGLRKYMKKHQQVNLIKEFHHFVFMSLLLPIYVIDYSLDEEFYNKK